MYPKFTEHLKNKIPKLKDNQRIIDAIAKYGDMGASEVKEDLQWGKGPPIKIVQLDIYKNCVGQYNINDPSSLLIDVDFVNDLENTTFGSQNADALSFLIGATVLHEYVHFSEWRDKSWNSFKDSGILFENEVYGLAVWRTKDAKLILRGNK